MRKKETSIRDLFAKVANNLNSQGVLPPVARKWTASNVQSTIYRGKDIPALFVEFEKVKKEFNYQSKPLK